MRVTASPPGASHLIPHSGLMGSVGPRPPPCLFAGLFLASSLALSHCISPVTEYRLRLDCMHSIPLFWLFLDLLLVSVSVCVLFFGPLRSPSPCCLLAIDLSAHTPALFSISGFHYILLTSCPPRFVVWSSTSVE